MRHNEKEKEGVRLSAGAGTAEKPLSGIPERGKVYLRFRISP